MLPLAEFAYNNNYHSNIEMAAYEALYGRLSYITLLDISGEARIYRTINGLKDSRASGHAQGPDLRSS